MLVQSIGNHFDFVKISALIGSEPCSRVQRTFVADIVGLVSLVAVLVVLIISCETIVRTEQKAS
jgi:hypothetical protein